MLFCQSHDGIHIRTLAKEMDRHNRLDGSGFFRVSREPRLQSAGIQVERVRIDIEKSEPVSVTRATAYRTGGITVIQGEAGYPITTHYGNFRGHIDIDLTLPNGEVFKTRNVAITRKRIPKKRGRKATFSSRFSVDPPKGTVVHIRYHAGPHKADGAT